MKRQKRGKCKLWRSFTNIFRRKSSTDETETPQPPFAAVGIVFPPTSDTVEEKPSPSKTVGFSKVPVSPEKKHLPKPVEQKIPGDLDAVGRIEGLVNTDIARDRIRIKPDNRRVPGKYNQKQSVDSESPEDFAAVRSESQDESANSKDENGTTVPDSAPGELSSGSDTAEQSARVALLPTKPLPKAPVKKQRDEEPVEEAEFIRIPSKKKLGSSRSDEAKKLQQNVNGIEKSVNPEVVNLAISESQINRANDEIEAEKVTATEMRPGSKEKGGNDSKIRHSVSMHEVKRLTVKAARSGADDVVAESAKLSVESAKLSSSAKERKLANKTDSLNVESKTEAQATDSSTLESKSKAAKQDSVLPLQGSLQKLSKVVKATSEKIESNPPEESNFEKSLKRSESKLKAEAKGVEGVHAPLGGRSSFKRNSSRRNSARKSGLLFPESHDESTAKNPVQEDSKRATEDKNKVPKIVMPVTDLPVGKELLAGKGSGEREEAQKVLDQSSNTLQDPDKGSNSIEVRGLADDLTAEPVSVAGGREMLNGKGREDVREGEKKGAQEVKRIGSSRKPDFVSPAVPAKALQKGKDIRNGIQNDITTVAATDTTEIKKLLPAAENPTNDVHKRMSKMPDEGGMNEFNRVLQKVQNKPNASSESRAASTDALPLVTKTESKGDAAILSATENGGTKPTKVVPIPPKMYRGDLGGSQKVTPGEGKSAPSTNLSASLSSNRNSHSRSPSVTAGEIKAQSDGTEVEKSKVDVGSSSVKTKGPPPVVNRSGKVQPRVVENTKDPDNAWIGKAKRMSKDFGEKMLQIEAKAEDIKADGEVKTNDNFERGGTRSSVRDMVKKLQKHNQAS